MSDRSYYRPANRLKNYLKIIVPTLLAAVAIGDQCHGQRKQRRNSKNGWDFVAEKYDTDGNGTVSRKEYTRSDSAFDLLDIDGDGMLSGDDWKGRQRRKSGGQAPAAGDVAPNFSLTEVKDPTRTISLSNFAGQKPVALLFGSCT